MFKNLKIDQRILFFSIVIIYTLFFYTTIRSPLNMDNSVSFNPDESSLIFTAKNIEQNGEIFWSSELNEKYATSYFHPRGMLETRKNTYITKYSVYFSILSSLSFIFSFNMFLIPMISFMGLVFFYMFLKDLFTEKIGIIGTLLLGIFPSYMLYSQVHMDIIPAISFWFGALFCFNRFLKDNKLRYLVLSMVFFTLTVVIRTPLIIAGLSFLFPTLVHFKKFLNYKAVIVISATVFLLVLLYLGIYREIFGSFVETGRTTNFSLSHEKSLAKTFMIPKIRLEPMMTNFTTYFLKYCPIISSIGVLGIFSIVLKRKYLRLWILSLILLSVYLFLIHGRTSGGCGFGTTAIQSSYSRYFLPIHVLLVIGTSYAFYYLFKKRKYIRIPLITVLIVFIFLFSFDTGTRGIVDIKTYMNEAQETKLKIKNTHEKSVFLVKMSDKIIIDARPIFLCQDFENGKRDIDELLRVINLLKKDGYTIYFSENLENLTKELVKHDITLIDIEEFPFYKLKINSHIRNTV